jgi:hypothetical protein
MDKPKLALRQCSVPVVPLRASDARSDIGRTPLQHSPDAVRFLYSSLGFSRSVPTLMPLAPPDQIRRTSSCNNCRSWHPGDESPTMQAAGRAGTARSAAAEAEGPEARRRNAHRRSTNYARNTSLTSGVEYRTTPSLFRRRE